MRNMIVVPVLLCTGLIGCGSMKKDMQTMCDGPGKVEGLEKYDPADRMTIVAGWVAEHLETKTGKSVFEAMGKVSPQDRPKIMRQAAKEEGVEPCAFADALEAAHKTAP